MEKKTSLVGSIESYMCKKTVSNNINCWTFKYCSFIRMKVFPMVMKSGDYFLCS